MSGRVVRTLRIRCSECLGVADLPAAEGTISGADARGAGGPRCGECGAPLDLRSPLPVAPDDFPATVLQAPIPVLVDFYADWCEPCRWLDPYLEEVTTARAGRLLAVKVDVDEAPGIAETYGVRSVPLVVLFRDGAEVDRSAGIEPERLREMADRALTRPT